MNRINTLIASLRTRYARWQLNRDIRNLESILARRSASVARYVEGGPVWIDVAEHRTYFQGADEPLEVTTYDPVERIRKLIKTHYR